MAAAGSVPVVLRVVSASVSIAHRAGQIIRDIMKKGELGIVEKGKNDLQTEADRSAQRCIIASLNKQFPKMAIFGEENLDPNDVIPADFIDTGLAEEVLAKTCPGEWRGVKEDELVVWVDPLDGTSEYTQGLLDHVTVLIGVAVKGTGKAIAGVIYQPFYNYQAGPEATRGRAIWGMIGLGAFGFNHTPAPEGQNIVTTTRSHSNKTVVDAVEASEPTEVTRVGGAGHKVLLLLEGQAHAYVFASPGCKKWDTCAPEAVLHAVGGKLTDIHGKDLLYHPMVQRRNTAGVLATPLIKTHDWYLQRIPAHVKEQLPSDI